MLFLKAPDIYTVVLFAGNHVIMQMKNRLLRRRTKEAYRLHKALLREGEPRVAIDLALIYAAREITDYKTIEHAVRRILERIVQGL